MQRLSQAAFSSSVIQPKVYNGSEYLNICRVTDITRSVSKYTRQISQLGLLVKAFLRTSIWLNGQGFEFKMDSPAEFRGFTLKELLENSEV